MKRILGAAFSLLLLVGCTSVPGEGTGSLLSAVGNVSGDMKGPQVFLLGQPVNALISVHGEFSYTILPYPPYLTYDGDLQFLVEPISGHEAEAIQAVSNGDLLIRRGGVAGALNPVGSIRRWKAMAAASAASTNAANTAAAVKAAVDASKAAPSPEAAPEPTPLVPGKEPPAGPVTMVPATVAGPLPSSIGSPVGPSCTDGVCSIPGMIYVSRSFPR